MTSAELSPLAAHLLGVLERVRRAKLDELVAAAQAADLSMIGDPDARQRLLTAITELADAGLAELPPVGGAQWQRSPRPSLPRWIRRPAPPAEPVAPSPGVAWHGRLWWVPKFAAGERPTSGELELLRAVNRFLSDGGGDGGTDRPVVPLRERSWQLLRDEKALDRYVRGRLFRAERLDVELLRARVVLPAPVATQIGAGPVTLVVENYTTYASLAALLPPDGRVGQVVWGAGNQLSTVLGALAGTGVAELRYFGDLDARGLEIADGAAALAPDLGLPPLLPARSLYVALLATGSVQPTRARPLPQALQWLPEDLRTAARAVLERGRIAQEAVGVEVLAELDLRDP